MGLGSVRGGLGSVRGGLGSVRGGVRDSQIVSALNYIYQLLLA